MSSQRLIQRILPAAFVVLALAIAWLYRQPPGSTPGTSPGRSAAARTAVEGGQPSDGIRGSLRSGQMVEVTGRVSRLLADDNEGSRHQRFILALGDGKTFLVAHNIDLAPRVPVALGDSARVRGQYEHNERGGVLHWTHHDPAGRRRDTGWIEHQGEVYQ